MSNLKKHLQSCQGAISNENNNINTISSSKTEEQIKKLIKTSYSGLIGGGALGDAGLNKMLAFS